MVGLFVGIAAGGSVIASQFYGAGAVEETRRTMHTAIAFSLAGGIVLMILGYVFTPIALRITGTPEDVMSDAISYMRIYFLGIIGNLIYNMGSGLLRALGDSKSPLYFLVVCTITNLVLDLLFVIVFHWGVAGVAIATILAQALSACLVLLKLFRSDTQYKLSFREIRFHGATLRKIVQIGFPNGLQSVMYSVSNIIVQASINSFGTKTVAAWSAYSKADGLFWMIINAFGIAATTFSGQNFGAQKYDRVRKSVRVGLGLSFMSSVSLSFILYGGGQFVFRLFVQDDSVISIGLTILHTIVPFYFTYIFIEILAGAIRGTGDSLIPTIITSFGICGIRVIWCAFIVPQWHNIQIVALGYPVAWIITSLAFIIYYRCGSWMKRQIRKSGFTNVEQT